MTNNENTNIKLLETIKKELEKDELKEIIDSPYFYFSEGLDAFKDLEIENLENLQNEFGNTTKVKEFVAEKKNNNKTLLIESLDKINKFISYCDLHALGTNSKGESFQETKKYIANAFVRQHIWVKSIIAYLLNNKEDKNQNEELKFKNVTYSVQNAIKYFENPEERFPILSKDHREKISLYYLNHELVDNKFDINLKEKFDKEITNIQCDKNRTHVYTQIIYSQRKEWSNEIDTSFLENNRNIILTGAPGTGKTYLAQKMAEKLTNTKSDDKENPQIKMVQFHPSYDYTDFVEGLRPKTDDNGNIGFERKDGVFKKFCKEAAKDEAAKDENKKYVFIIDEINRGEISKIFGELFFSIDPGYRGTKGKVDTQYQNLLEGTNDEFKDGFYVPENVYIIGTMNDIDRSVESMDFAFRRRFAFKEIKADDTKDDILYILKENENVAINAMEAINEKLNELGLSDSYHIGAAYFTKIENYDKQSKNKWNSLWKYHLEGTLFEYFRGEPNASENIKALKDVYDKAVQETKS